MAIDFGCRECGSIGELHEDPDCPGSISLLIPVSQIFLHPESYGKEIDDLEYLMTMVVKGKVDAERVDITTQQCYPELVRPSQQYVYSNDIQFFIAHDSRVYGDPVIARMASGREWHLMDGHHRLAAKIIKFGRAEFKASAYVFEDGLVL